MGAAAHYLEVHAPAQACYDWWRPLTRLSEIFTDVQAVEALDHEQNRTEWTVHGPAGTTIRWQARIAEDRPPHRLAWATVDDADPDVAHSGVVRFDDKGDGTTGVEVSLEYNPPGGALGDAAAALFSDPQTKVEQACREFKLIIETR